MTAPAWPDGLPMPLISGYTLEPAEQVLRSTVEGGAEQVRRIAWERVDKVQASWRFTDDQFNLFRRWFRGEGWSAIGDSNDFSTGWLTPTGAVGGNNAAVSPRNSAAWRLQEDTSTGDHHMQRAVANVADNAPLLVIASVSKHSTRNARVGFTNKAINAVIGVTIAPSTGAVLASYGSPGFVQVTRRDANHWRVAVRGSVGVGTGDPRVRLGLANGTSATYAGNGSGFVDWAEVQARNGNSNNTLYGPTDSLGRLEGAAGGAAWFRAPMTFGGNIRWLECRFDSPWKATLLPGMSWSVTAALEARFI